MSPLRATTHLPSDKLLVGEAATSDMFTYSLEPATVVIWVATLTEQTAARNTVPVPALQVDAEASTELVSAS